MARSRTSSSHAEGLCKLKRSIPLGTLVEDFISGREGRVIILNPSDEASGLVGVRWLDNGHEAKIMRDQLL